MDYSEYLKRPFFTRQAAGDDRRIVLRYEEGEDRIESVFRRVAWVVYEGQNYAILQPEDRAAFSTETFEFPENAALVFRIGEDGVRYERIFDLAVTRTVFDEYRKTYPGPYAEDALALVETFYRGEPQEIRFEYVDEPNDGADGAIILKNPNGDSIKFIVVDTIPYRGTFYLLLAVDAETATALGVPENGAFVFRWGKREPTPELFLMLDETLVSAIIGEHNKKVNR